MILLCEFPAIYLRKHFFCGCGAEAPSSNPNPHPGPTFLVLWLCGSVCVCACVGVCLCVCVCVIVHFSGNDDACMHVCVWGVCRTILLGLITGICSLPAEFVFSFDTAVAPAGSGAWPPDPDAPDPDAMVSRRFALLSFAWSRSRFASVAPGVLSETRIFTTRSPIPWKVWLFASINWTHPNNINVANSRKNIATVVLPKVVQH